MFQEVSSISCVTFQDFITFQRRQKDGFFPALSCEIIHAAAGAKSLQSCPTLCNPIEGSPPGSPIPGILQARTLEWVAISFSNAGKWKVKVKLLSRVRLLATPWTAAYQPPPSMGFSRQEYWSGVPLPSLNTCWTSKWSSVLLKTSSAWVYSKSSHTLLLYQALKKWF